MLKAEVENNMDKAGFLFDGFPRTIPQADALDAFLKSINLEVTATVGLDANDSIIVACSNKNTEGKRLSVISDSFSELEDNYKKVNCIYEISWD